MPDLSNDSLSESLAVILHDYRQGEIAAPTVEHINYWIEQFPQDVQEPMLKELNHVLSLTYLSKDWVLENISGLVNNNKLTSSFLEKCQYIANTTRGVKSERFTL